MTAVAVKYLRGILSLMHLLRSTVMTKNFLPVASLDKPFDDRSLIGELLGEFSEVH